MTTVSANTRTASKLAAFVVVMFGFGYALVPLYEVFCDVTGFRGKTGEITEAQAGAVDRTRWVTVEFDTNVNGSLPWKFRPMKRKVKVHPGEIGEALFHVENVSARTITGQAVPSVTPAQAAVYFNKTECFCFTQQTLEAGEKTEMPVRFVVDSGLPEKISTLTLSYTFFEAPDSIAAIGSQPNEN